MKISIEFAGGLQVLFEDKMKLEIEIEKEMNLSELLKLMREKYVKRTPELFVNENGNIRAGILVLINDCDWELEDSYQYVLKDRDVISFISTLHGG